VDSFRRLIPFILPHRRRLVVSVLFGFIVAALWGANLTAVFPIVKVLLEQKSIAQFVDEEIEAAQAEVDHRRANVERNDAEIARLEQANRPADDAALLAALSSRVDNEHKLNAASRTLLTMTRVRMHVVPWVPQNPFKAFAAILALLLIAETVKGIFIFAQDMMIGSVVQRVVIAVRGRCLERVLGLDYQTLARDGTGALMSRFTYDTEQIAQGIMLIGARLVREPLKCLVCTVLALWLNWRLTVLSLLFLPLLVLFLGWYGRSLKRASRRMMDSMSRIYKVLEETLDGLKVVIAFGTAAHHHAQFAAENDRFYQKAMRVVRVDAVAKPTMEVLGLLAMFIAMLPGAYLVLRQKTDIFGIRLADNAMSAAELCALYALLVGLIDPSRKMSATFSRLKRCSAALDRIFELMDRQPQVRETADARPLPRFHESIEFRQVSFEYPAREAAELRGPALISVSLTVRAGEAIAIVGQNGCGKSTLLSMLPRLYDPTAGEILIDGLPLKEVRFADLRSQIGLVTQETILFDDSIYENIRYGKPSATREEIEEAARQARVMEIVETVPHGFETRVGERGKELSGGQRQRIALARSIVRNPSILILDEATSAADARSETLIYEALQSFSTGRTVFIITHSMTPALLKLIDRIVVMHAGRIVAVGRHEELLQTCPVYDSLYHADSRARAA
jgi:subfamily B ATP-binding cassette protein MsbA